MRWSISLRPVRHMPTLSHISQKNNKSLQLTLALYYLPIVLSITTKHNFICFNVWSPDWKILQNVACRTGHPSTESPLSIYFKNMIIDKHNFCWGRSHLQKHIIRILKHIHKNDFCGGHLGAPIAPPPLSAPCSYAPGLYTGLSEFW